MTVGYGFIHQKHYPQRHTSFKITSLLGTALVFQLMSRAAGISQLGLEISRSHALIFLQEPSFRSHRLAHSLHIDLGQVSLAAQVGPVDFKTVFYDALEFGNIPRLEDFLLLRPRP